MDGIQILSAQETKAFDITPDEIYDMLSPPNSTHYFQTIGGPEGMAKLLKSDLERGLNVSVTEPAAPAEDKSNSNNAPAKDAYGLKRRNSILGESTSKRHSISEKMAFEDLEARIAHFGTNSMPEAVSRTVWSFILDALNDKILIMLIVAAIAEICIGIYKTTQGSAAELIDGVAIWVAVLIVISVTAASDYSKQNQFKKLSDMSKALIKTRVIRGGQIHKILNSELLVGDICVIDTGDVLPADGVLIKGYNLNTDESSLTGEPIQIAKDVHRDPFLLSGSKVVQGIGRMLVIATGVNSLNGRSILALEVEPEKTPLQEKLGRVADQVAYFGIGAAMSMFIILIAGYLAAADYSNGSAIGSTVIYIVISTITLIVVAVPEGLPLAVVLALSHATVQMLKDNNLVRHLKACETMGNATTICSDKTGTLTLNQMTVLKGSICNKQFDQNSIPKFKNAVAGKNDDFVKLFALVCHSVNVNSTAAEELTETNKMIFSGSKTEIAILNLTRAFGHPYTIDREQAEIVELYPFSSDAKIMCTVVKYKKDISMERFMNLQTSINDTDYRIWLFVKGAAEIVLAACTSYLDSDGKVKPITDEFKKQMEDLMAAYNAEALRTICAATKPVHRDLDVKTGENDGTPQKCTEIDSLIFLGMFGIADPVRPEVPDAVKRCQRAGITVRMVTGDSVATARAISKECNILTEDGILMEGHVFRKLSFKEMDEILPKLQVLARSSPLDKQILVGRLKKLGETVAVTGDGTNDGPALKSADVGFSMGITGTEVAKEASDIVLLDDNFASLVKAVVWGRSVFDSVRKFLMFQLSVNVSAVVIVFVTSLLTTFSGNRRPQSGITAIQLLWVNLIMDTMAALALATDPPAPQLLNRLPAKRSEPIISFFMALMILFQAAFQIVLCMLVYLKGAEWFLPPEFNDTPAKVEYASALVFNTFVFCQIYNEVNSRSINNDMNIFRGITQNYYFMSIFVITVGLQVIIMFFGSIVFSIPPGGLTAGGWAASVCLPLGTFVVGILVRLLPSREWKDISSRFGDSEKAIDESVIDFSTEAALQIPIKNGPIEVLNERSEEPALVPTDSSSPIKPVDSTRAQSNWKRVIEKTQMQIKVIKAFQIPGSAQTSFSSLTSSQLLYRNANAGTAHRESSFVSTIRGGRTNASDYIALQIIDANEIRDKAHGLE